MPIIVKHAKSDYTPAPEGLHPAVCCDVVDRGIEETPWGDAHKVEIIWQLEEKNTKYDKPFLVRRKYRLSLHEKSSLRPMLEAWRGRKFTTEELEGFDLEKLIGVNCQVQVIHNVKDNGDVYANVQAVVPPPKNGVKLRVDTEYVRVAEREERKRLEHESVPYHAEDSDVPF